MRRVRTDDEVELWCEETGSGEPLVFVHEFAGDARSWEPQVRYFSRRYRCVAFNARGYPPSDVPSSPASYSQDRARLDILAVLDGLEIPRAHVVGLSMGGFATLHFGLHHPERASSLVVAGCGYGAEAEQRERFREEAEATAHLIESSSGEAFADRYGSGPTRVQFKTKDPRGWREFRDQLAEHSLLGAANTMRGVQRERPSLYDLEPALRALRVPTLVMTGDEDEPCLLPNVYLKRTIPTSALVVLPRSGHTINLEEPELFNRAVDDFLNQVRAGRWGERDPSSVGGSILGVQRD
jgi:pimeloyl-ACP methyl ester carboxylesterase